MLGLGWTEMMVIGVVALIVIGPKDLPVVMNRIGKIAGQIRRMGSDFQREINKTTGLDEVRNLRNSITTPLKKTSEEIRREFNAMTPSGPKPSGVIKPADPSAESVVDEIRAAAGMTPAKTADQVAAEAGFRPPGPAPVAPKAATAEPAAAPARKPAVRKSPAKAKAAPTAPVVANDLPPLGDESAAAKSAAKPAAKKPAAKKPAAVKKTTAAASAPAAVPVAKPAPKKRAAKPVAETSKAGDA
jgi:sec-independent protein translocase protein TatB